MHDVDGRLAASVINVQSNGYLVVAGERSIAFNRYVMNQTFRVRNLSGGDIANVRIFQLMHGYTSQQGVYDNRTYPGKLSQYHYDATLSGIDAGAAGEDSSASGLEDFIAFQSKVAPTAFEIGYYGIEGNGLDDHSIGKPSDGVHLSIEDDWQSLPYSSRQGTDSFAPSHKWIAGGQRWSVGNLTAGQSTDLDIVLSLLTGTKVTTTGGGGAPAATCPCNVVTADFASRALSAGPCSRDVLESA